MYIEHPGGKKEPLLLNVLRGSDRWGFTEHPADISGPFTAKPGEGGRPRTGRPFFYFREPGGKGQSIR